MCPSTHVYNLMLLWLVDGMVVGLLALELSRQSFIPLHSSSPWPFTSHAQEMGIETDIWRLLVVREGLCKTSRSNGHLALFMGSMVKWLLQHRQLQLPFNALQLQLPLQARQMRLACLWHPLFLCLICCNMNGVLFLNVRLCASTSSRSVCKR